MMQRSFSSDFFSFNNKPIGLKDATPGFTAVTADDSLPAIRYE
jgi:hypothetical protein